MQRQTPLRFEPQASCSVFPRSGERAKYKPSTNMRIYRLWRSSFVEQHVSKFVPPVVFNMAKYLFPEMVYAPQGWYLQNSRSQGWFERSVAEAQAKHWPTLVKNLEGTGPLGVAHFPWSFTREDRTNHNAMMSYGYVLALVARNKERISILDWGGGAGHYYLYSKALLPEVGMEYHCYDVPYLCELGRELTPQAQFHASDADLAAKQFDLVVSSSSLHYFENWREVTRKLAAFTREFLYIARLQTVSRAPSFVAVHKLHRAGYTEHLSWCLNHLELVSCVEESGLELVREFVFGEKWSIPRAPDKVDSRGFLFRRRKRTPDEKR
jgi:putative methyltransferase (TIGR04325 family)